MLKTTISEITRKSFVEKLDGSNHLTFDEFVDWALYDPVIGYYRKNKIRVGKSKETDFYTSTCISHLWPELIIESCIKLIAPHPPSSFSFIEIGAEPNTSLLQNNNHPFASFSAIRKGDAFEIPNRSIVYANEWLDAQPFKRFSFSKDKNLWHEHGVSIHNDSLIEIKIQDSDGSQLPVPNWDKNHLSDGYTIDFPEGADRILNEMLNSSSWSGLFLTFDYGMQTRELFENRPSGTARAYKNHTMQNNLLCNPGDQDITCHVCWDPLMNTLDKFGFKNIEVNSQESFFMNFGTSLLKQCIRDGDRQKINAVKEIIHPQMMGQKFQALHAFKD